MELTSFFEVFGAIKKFSSAGLTSLLEIFCAMLEVSSAELISSFLDIFGEI